MANVFISKNDDMQHLSLMWHQKVRIASVVDKIWLCNPKTAGVPGILIADEVGIGKTALIMGTLAFIIDVYWVQEFLAGRVKSGTAHSLKSLNLSDVTMAPLLREFLIFYDCCTHTRERWVADRQQSSRLPTVCSAHGPHRAP